MEEMAAQEEEMEDNREEAEMAREIGADKKAPSAWVEPLLGRILQMGPK